MSSDPPATRQPRRARGQGTRPTGEARTAAPRVSVVLPIYNAARFLGEAVDSVRAQSYEDWELLLVDDGSTDGSAALAEAYAASDPERIRFLHHRGRSNRGASATRNLGIAHARGEFLALLDADDVWLPTKLEKQIEVLERRPDIAVLGTFYDEVDGGGRRRTSVRLPCSHWDVAWALVCYCPLLHSSVLLRRALVAEHIGWYDESLPTAEDYDLWTRVSRRFRLENLPGFLVRYRVHEASLSMTRGRREAHGHRLRQQAIARMLGWNDAGQAEQRRRYRAITALVLGWTDRPDPQSLLEAVDHLQRLHAEFCRSRGYPRRVVQRQRRQLDSRTAASLVGFSGRFVSDHPHHARALFWRAVRIHRRVLIRFRTVRRAARILASSLRLPGGSRGGSGV